MGIENITSAQDNVTFICKLACFSTGLQCALYNTTAKTSNVGNIIESDTDYNYPTQMITLTDLRSNTIDYCVVAVNKTDKMRVGDLVCGNVTIMNDIGGEIKGKYWCYYIL